MSKISEKPGFTLIEILVAVTIILLLTSIGVASYNRFNDKRKVEKITKELETNLRYIQGKATSNEKDCTAAVCDCSGANYVLTGWYADFTNLLAPTYYGDCSGVTFSNPAKSLV